MILLSREGIFPIIYDALGRKLTEIPASGIDLSGTIQGEGKLSGVPSLFIRLAGCNLKCVWKNEYGDVSECDTSHASFKLAGAYNADEDEVFKIVVNNTNTINHIVITGGEPLLQASSLVRLCRKLKSHKDYHITIETNGTIFNEGLASCIDLFSISPKLNSSVLDKDLINRIDIDVLDKYIAHANKYAKDFQLKFVFAQDNDISEIDDILVQLQGWKPEDVLLMPLGGNMAEVKKNKDKVLYYCLLKGWRYCDRLHISLFSVNEGV